MIEQDVSSLRTGTESFLENAVCVANGDKIAERGKNFWITIDKESWFWRKMECPKMTYPIRRRFSALFLSQKLFPLTHPRSLQSLCSVPGSVYKRFISLSAICYRSFETLSDPSPLRTYCIRCANIAYRSQQRTELGLKSHKGNYI